jgi:predicted dehydrogenase
MAKHQRDNMDRRSFLKTAASAFALAGLGLTPGGRNEEQSQEKRKVQLENPQIGQPVSQTAKARGGQPVVPKPPYKPLGYCLVGLGKFAVGQILPAFAECQHSRPVALVSGERDKAEAVAARYGISRKKIYNYKNYDDIRHDPDIDIVYIILPNAMHAEYTIRAHLAGKHVLCEKPMATNVKDCREMIAAANQAERTLMIAYRAQYEPYNQTAIEWSQNQKYGPIQFMGSVTVVDIGGPNQWRLDKSLAGGGSLVDIGIYSLNAMRYLTGEEPIAVTALQHQNRDDPRFREVEQTILFQLRFPSGVVANCSSSYSTRPINHYEVAFRDGWLKLDPATTYTGQRFYHGTNDREEQLLLPHVNQFATEMDYFANAIKNKEPVKTAGEEGLKDVKYMELIYEAARSGKTVETV